MSPALTMLASLPPDRVAARTAEGKRLRRQALKGAVIVFVTAGYSGKRFIFERAKELGVRSVVLDGPDSWAQALAADGVIERFVPLDFSDADAVFDNALAAIAAAKKDLGDVDGVATFCELAVPLVSRLAERLGLPGNTPAAVDAARDKSATRKVMEAAGLPNPRSFLIEAADQLAAAGDHVGFPAVIKPIHGAASIGVVRVDDAAALAAAYARVQKEMASATIVAGALQQGDAEAATPTAEEAADKTASAWIKTTLMLEEYLDGPEVDVDLVYADGAPVYGAVTDNWPTVEPYFNETGSNCPSTLPVETQAALVDLAVRSVAALGFDCGAFHVELKATSRGPRLIEVNCRMGGGPVRATNLLVWGVDLVEEHLLTAAGIPARPPVSPVPLKHIAEYSINANKTGRMAHAAFMDKWAEHPDVLYARALVAPGDRVTCVDDGMPTWVAELMVAKPTVEEAIEFVQAIEREVSAALPIE
jgi:carnosine synthase